MPTVSTERAEAIVTSWLTSTEPVDGIDHPAGPLYLNGYTESDITMTGGWPFTDGGGCCMCTGSIENGWSIECC